MTRHPDRARENRVRQMARRQGLRLMKSPRRDPLAADYGRYVLSDRRCRPDSLDRYVFGTDDEREVVYGATLAEAEMWLRSGAWRELQRERAREAERASAMATRMSRGTSRNEPRSDARSDAGRPRSDARSDARMPGAMPGGPEAVPGWADLPDISPRSRLRPWRRANGAVVATRPPDEETSIWDR